MSVNWKDNLVDPHLKIASSNANRIAILAGPGTGKTTYGLLRRIMRLLQEDKINPENILFLTFARTAAEDFVRKLDESGVEGYENITATTVHSFCLKLLRDQQVFEITGRNADRILLKFEEDSMLHDLPTEFGTLTNRRKMLVEFSNGWARDVNSYPGTPATDLEKKFQEHILSWLKYHNAMLIGEVVPIAYNYLSNNPASPILEQYTHIIVDEYQDLNRTEQELLEVLVGKNGAICVAGDDDQSIYGFRCANPDGIKTFFDNANEKINIEVCGRCPKPILNIANKIKENLPDKLKGSMNVLDESAEGYVNVVQWNDNEEESQGIASAINLDISSGRRDPGDFLILVQSKVLGKKIRNKIKEYNIECHSFFQEDPISGNDSKRAVTILELLVNENDAVSLRYWLGHGDASSRSIAYSKIKLAADENKISIKDTLDRVIKGELKVAGVSSLVNRYKNLLEIKGNLKDKSLEDVVNLIFPDSIDDLEDLRQIAQTVLPNCSSNKDLLIEMIKVITQPGVPEHPNFVRVMSLHKSKGLTSEVVYITSMIQGLIPKNIGTNEEIQESRRLFYVGITRAKSELLLSSFVSAPFQTLKSLMVPSGKFVKTDGGQKYFQTIASQFMSEIAPVLPRAITGDSWLDTKNKK